MPGTLILGDVHLGKGLSIGKAGVGAGLNSRVTDQMNLLDWTLDQAIELGVKRIIATGDIFEEPKPHPTLIKLFISWLKKCEVNDVEVHIIYGNHDILRSGQFSSSVLDVVSEAEITNVTVYSSLDTIYCDGVGFTLLPFRDRRSFNLEKHDDAVESIRKKLVFEAADIPPTYKKVLIGHLALEGSIYVGDEIDDASNEIFCPLSMFKDYDYVWMGHIHKPQVLSKKPYIAHVGSMDRSDVGESDHNKIVVLIDPAMNGFFKEIEIPVRPLEKIVVQVPADTTDTTEFVLDAIKDEKTNLKNGIVKLEIQLLGQDLRSVNRKSIENYLQTEGVFHVASFSETKKISLLKKKDDNISHVMTESNAIREWSKKFVEEKRRDKFVALAEEIRAEMNAEDKS